MNVQSVKRAVIGLVLGLFASSLFGYEVAVDSHGILNVTYSMPTITITSFDPKTGVVRIKVVSGEGNKIVSEIATGYVHVYGSSNLADKMKLISKVGFDLTPYLKADTKGEAVLQIELGSHSFLRVKVEETTARE